MSGYALAIGRVPAMGALPRGRRAHGLVLAVVALVAMAGLELVRPLVAADPSPSSATGGHGPGRGGLAGGPAGWRPRPPSPPTPTASPPTPDGTWAASTPAQGLRSRFGPAGPTRRVRSPGGWDLELSLARLGRPGALAPVAAAQVVGSAEGVQYRRGPALTEWYRNEARGLEQGFDRGPPHRQAGTVPSSSRWTPRAWPWP